MVTLYLYNIRIYEFLFVKVWSQWFINDLKGWITTGKKNQENELNLGKPKNFFFSEPFSKSFKKKLFFLSGPA